MVISDPMVKVISGPMVISDPVVINDPMVISDYMVKVICDPMVISDPMVKVISDPMGIPWWSHSDFLSNKDQLFHYFSSAIRGYIKIKNPWPSWYPWYNWGNSRPFSITIMWPTGRFLYLFQVDSSRILNVSIADIPEEVVIKILGYLPRNDLLLNAALVCSEWRRLTESQQLWRRIDLTGIKNVSSELVQKLLKKSQSIVYINLYNCSFIEDSVFLEIAKQIKLQTLILGRYESSFSAYQWPEYHLFDMYGGTDIAIQSRVENIASLDHRWSAVWSRLVIQSWSSLICSVIQTRDPVLIIVDLQCDPNSWSSLDHRWSAVWSRLVIQSWSSLICSVIPTRDPVSIIVDLQCDPDSWSSLDHRDLQCDPNSWSSLDHRWSAVWSQLMIQSWSSLICSVIQTRDPVLIIVDLQCDPNSWSSLDHRWSAVWSQLMIQSWSSLICSVIQTRDPVSIIVDLQCDPNSWSSLDNRWSAVWSQLVIQSWSSLICSVIQTRDPVSIIVDLQCDPNSWSSLDHRWSAVWSRLVIQSWSSLICSVIQTRDPVLIIVDLQCDPDSWSSLDHRWSAVWSRLVIQSWSSLICSVIQTLEKIYFDVLILKQFLKLISSNDSISFNLNK